MSKINKTDKSDARFTESGTFKSHRLFLDSQMVQKPKVTIAVLALVTLLAALGGWYLIKFGEFDDLFENGQTLRRSPVAAQNTVPILSCTLDGVSVDLLAAGTEDKFYVASGSSVSQYRIQYLGNRIAAESLWKRDFGAPVTALHYVCGEKALDGMLLVALGNRIETVNPNQSEGSGTEFAKLEDDSLVVSLTTDATSVYAADAKGKIVRQFDMLGAKKLEIGQPDEAAGWSGFQLTAEPIFPLDIAPDSNTLYVGDPGTRRIEAFETSNGAWQKERSIANLSTGKKSAASYNPALILVLPNTSILTLERGERTIFRSFSPQGDLLTEIDDPNTSPSTSAAIAQIALGRSLGGKNHLLIFTPPGRLDLYPDLSFEAK